MNLSSNFLEFNFLVTNGQNQIVFEFDEFRLDTAKLMLYRSGQEINLPPKVVETLLVLIENRGEIVSKDELMKKVWAETIVEESNLSQYLYQLRKVLGLHADGQPFIETFRRRGYRFNGDVQIYQNVYDHTGKDWFSGESERPDHLWKRVDWPAENLVPASPGTSTDNSHWPQLLMGKTAILTAVVVILLISSAFYFRYRFASADDPGLSASNKELTFTRITNGSSPIDATISPDGKFLVYHEQDGATAHVWLQQTGGSHRSEIFPASGKAIRGKTFSPDSQFIYFVASDDLKSNPVLYRVPAIGGEPVRILENVFSPVSFSPDGKQLIFQRVNLQNNDSFLVVADSNGGNEKILLTKTKEQGLLSFPAWSPDGRVIAFGISNFAGEGGTINTLDLQTGLVKTLSLEKWATIYRMVWTRDGTGLVFIGTKFREGMTTRRDQIYYLSTTTGEARRLTTDGNRHQSNSLGITETDEILAVPFNRSSQIWQLEPSGDARTAIQITNGLADGRAGLAALPDGRITYISRLGENLSVWTANADGSNQRQLTFDPPFVEEVRASPTGNFLVFASEHEGQSHLFRIDPNGTNLRQLTFGMGRNTDSTISPDGRWIVYYSEISDKGQMKGSLRKVSVDGGEPVLLSDINCFTPHYSPDGKFISCILGVDKFVVISAEDGKILKTFEPVQVSYFNIGVRWSRDGKDLIYIARRKNFSNLWRQPINGGNPQPLTDFTSGELHNFAFSTDGSRLYVARGFEVRDAVLIKNFK